MSKEQYIKAFSSALKVDRKTKKKIVDDISFDISKRVSNGETMESIIEDMGEPKTLAGDFNSQLSKPRDKKLIYLWIVSAVSFCISLALTAKYIYLKYVLTGNASHTVGIIGGADGPTEIYVTANISGTESLVFGIIVFMAIALLSVFFILRRKKKNEE